MKKDRFYYCANLTGATVLVYLVVSLLLRKGLEGFLELVAPGASLSHPVGISALTLQLLDLLLRFLCLALPVLFLWGVEPAVRKALVLHKPKPDQLQYLLPIFLLLSTLCTALSSTLERLLQKPWQSSASPFFPQEGGAVAVFFVATCVLAPVGEELLFRGGLQTLLRPFGDWFSIFTVSLVFTLLHRNPSELISIFLLSTFFGYTACSSGGLLLSMLLHFANNFSSFLLLWARCRMNAASALGFTAMLFAVYLCCGIPALILAVRRRRFEKLPKRPPTGQKQMSRAERLVYAPVFSIAILLLVILFLLECLGA